MPAIGRWGPPTAPIDWCESNYAVHPGVAEFWNTISNVVFCLCGLQTWYYAVATRRDAKFHFLAFAVFMTGATSAFFHATLWWSGQKADEIFENISLLTMLYMGKEGSFAGMLTHWVAVAAGILLFEAVFCELHLFATVLATLKKYRLESAGRPHVLALTTRAAVLGGLAFALWIVDFAACRAVRGLPFNPQLHAWWHVLGACGLNDGIIAIFLLSFSEEEARPVGRILGLWTYLKAGKRAD
eukprot:comp8058_c0_seq1/m.3554 comp8058_c0_seq1/g.3554  ORF comp8058_c0_seq1/g.3554 comp8058_c0_seq1/m.3554 type:complete len:242 (-) comp8058_c0_seq1:3-728(-)